MNGLVGLGGTLAILLVLGSAIGLADRRHFAPRWLMLAALLVAVNDLCLTNAYRLLPDVIGGAWNWQGKALALAVTLIIATLPTLGWGPAGLRLSQRPGSLKASIPAVMFYAAFVIALAFLLPDEHHDAEEFAFQLTMPGFEEEPFYRGILLLALDRAFSGRIRFLGVDWGWGALLSCLLFGLAHAFGFSHGHFSFDALTMALTALPSLVAVWLRYRTGSLVLPILLHNFGNTAELLI